MLEKTAETAAELEMALCARKRELATLYYQAGKRLIDMAEDQQRLIDCLAADIIQLEKQLAEVRHDTLCGYCDSINTADSVYCKRCGARLNTKEMNP